MQSISLSRNGSRQHLVKNTLTTLGTAAGATTRLTNCRRGLPAP